MLLFIALENNLSNTLQKDGNVNIFEIKIVDK